MMRRRVYGLGGLLCYPKMTMGRVKRNGEPNCMISLGRGDTRNFATEREVSVPAPVCKVHSNPLCLRRLTREKDSGGGNKVLDV